MPRPIPLLVVAMLAFPAAKTSLAQPGATTADIARSHYDRGKALAAAGNLADAYREFEAGYNADPRPAFLFNMGEAARSMGDAVKARAAYERFLAVEPSGETADTARKRLAELRPAAAPAPAPRPTTVPPPHPITVPPPSVVAANVEATSEANRVSASPPPDEDRPLWKKWPVWAGVAGLVAAGIIISIVATRDRDVTCDANCVDFR
jgi:tetratricopeptide (TPR) repeat protein